MCLSLTRRGRAFRLSGDMMRVNGPYNEQTLKELINNVEAATINQDNVVFFPITVWMYELEKHPDRFYLENSQLRWLGGIVQTISGQEDMLIKKWREINEQNKTN